MSLPFPIGEGTIQYAGTAGEVVKEVQFNCGNNCTPEDYKKAFKAAGLENRFEQFTEEQRKAIYMIPWAGLVYGGFDAIKEGDITPLLQAGISQTEIGGLIMMMYRNQPNKPTESQIVQKIKDANSTSFNPNDVRFSQNTVSYNKTERGSDVKYTYDNLVSSMKKDGWKGEPVDVVKMNDGQYSQTLKRIFPLQHGEKQYRVG